jgi:hypothetical protein
MYFDDRTAEFTSYQVVFKPFEPKHIFIGDRMPEAGVTTDIKFGGGFVWV